MPASPEISTIWPSPVLALAHRRSKSSVSFSRPTSFVSRAECAASNRLSLAETPTAAHASTGSARPLTTCRPRSRKRNRSPSSRRVDADTTTPPVRDALQTSNEIGSVADYGLFLRRALADDLTDYDKAGRNADPHGELFACERPKVRHRVGDFQARMDRPRGVVLVRVWETEIGENAVAHKFGDEAVISRDDARTSVLIGADDVTHVLGIELRRYRGRTDEIAQHHS